MTRFAGYISFALAVVLVGAASSPARTRVYARVNAETAIYPGDVFQYSIVVEGGVRPSKIDVSALAPFNPRSAGSGTSMQQFNDKVTMTYSANYAITAKGPGKMVLPAVTAVVSGKTYTTNPVEVKVSAPGTTDRLSLEFTLSEKRCYVGQPVMMTVKWTVTARVQDASFNVPVFRSDDFYVEDVSQAAGAYATERATIDGVPVTVTENRQVVKGMQAAVISFSKVLIPRRAGRLVLDPVGVSTNMAVSRTRGFFEAYNYKRVSVQSDPVELEVLPLPQEGKPAQFYGLVGRYTIAASATPTQVNVGDPITLTIKIGGNPYLKPVQWPALEQIPALADNFKIPAEKASPVIEDGQKVFTQTIRANNDDVTEVPPIPLAYFDPQDGRYTVAETKPIALEVAPTRVLTNADVEGTGAATVSREVEAIRKGLSANYYGPAALTNEAFAPLPALASPPYAVLWSLPLLGLLASAGVKLARRTSPEAVARKRRRQASGSAVRQLQQIASAQANEKHERLIAAMKGYLGARFDRVAASLTPDDCHGIILDATGDARAAEKYRDRIAACEAARYAPMDARIDDRQLEEAIELVRRIEEKARR